MVARQSTSYFVIGHYDSLMRIRIRVVIVEDEPLSAEYLAKLLDDTWQVEVVGTAMDSEDNY